MSQLESLMLFNAWAIKVVELVLLAFMYLSVGA